MIQKHFGNTGVLQGFQRSAPYLQFEEDLVAVSMDRNLRGGQSFKDVAKASIRTGLAISEHGSLRKYQLQRASIHELQPDVELATGL